MGRLDTNPILQHFSHQHTLKLLNFTSQFSNDGPVCAACKLQVSGWTYNCSCCNYYLHKACSQMPQNKKHQIDPKHTLTLLSSPAYPQGAFKCNACGDHGTGFSYHCKDCELDLHTLCAHMPSSVKINYHIHTLSLVFSPPYRKKAFQCDICKGYGSNHWLYRCDSCNFDAHLNCAIANTQNKRDQHHHHQQQQQDQLVRSLSVNTPQFAAPINQYANMIHRFPSSSSSSSSQAFDQMGGGHNYYTAGMPNLVGSQYVQPPRTNKIMENNNLMGLVMKGVVDGVAQQAGQLLLGSILGGFSFI